MTIIFFLSKIQIQMVKMNEYLWQIDRIDSKHIESDFFVSKIVVKSWRREMWVGVANIKKIADTNSNSYIFMCACVCVCVCVCACFSILYVRVEWESTHASSPSHTLTHTHTHAHTHTRTHTKESETTSSIGMFEFLSCVYRQFLWIHCQYYFIFQTKKLSQLFLNLNDPFFQRWKRGSRNDKKEKLTFVGNTLIP